MILLARDAFVKLGKQLKMMRLNDFFGRLLEINTDQDPAEDDENIKNKLEKSRKKLNAEMDEVKLY